VLDILNQRVTGGIADSSAYVRSTAAQPYGEYGISSLTGSTENVAQKGVARFGNLRLFGTPGQHSMTFSTEGTSVSAYRAAVKVNIRQCQVGEVQLSDRCNPCGLSQYTFDRKACSDCPANALCNGTLVPVLGYWHSHARSSQVHRCRWSTACNFNESAVEAWQQAQRQEDGALLNNSDYLALLCNKGYEGNLCGKCQHGWGRVDNNYCVKCGPKPVIGLMYVLTVFYLLLVLAVSVWVQLQVGDEQHQSSTAAKAAQQQRTLTRTASAAPQGTSFRHSVSFRNVSFRLPRDVVIAGASTSTLDGISATNDRSSATAFDCMLSAIHEPEPAELLEPLNDDSHDCFASPLPPLRLAGHADSADGAHGSPVAEGLEDEPAAAGGEVGGCEEADAAEGENGGLDAAGIQEAASSGGSQVLSRCISELVECELPADVDGTPPASPARSRWSGSVRGAGSFGAEAEVEGSSRSSSGRPQRWNTALRSSTLHLRSASRMQMSRLVMAAVTTKKSLDAALFRNSNPSFTNVAIMYKVRCGAAGVQPCGGNICGP
jgi:hypothetical protein